MNQQPPSTAPPTPEQGLMITEEMVINNFTDVLDVEGPDKASDFIKDYRILLHDYPGWKSTEAKMKTILKNYNEELRKAQEQDREMMRQMAQAMLLMANQRTAQQPATNNQEQKSEATLTDQHIRRCLALLMEMKDSSGKPLFCKNNHWQAVFCILAEKLHFNDNDFEFFDGLMERIIPDKVNAPYSRSAVKNISQTPYHKPLKEWKYDETLMKKREPFQRMKEVAEQFLQLLEVTQKD